MPKNIFSFQKADFHMHSVFSDGTDSPEELLDKIKIAGIDVFSLTDHDTCAGCEQMSALIKNNRAPYFIPGIEFSTEDEHGKYHILGYGFRMEDSEVTRVAAYCHESRLIKAQKRMDFLKDAFGFAFSDDEIRLVLQQNNPGKPHIARLCVSHGYAKSITDAIDNYLSKYPGKDEKLTPQQAIQTILLSDGVPVLAHGFFGSGAQRLSMVFWDWKHFIPAFRKSKPLFYVRLPKKTSFLSLPEATITVKTRPCGSVRCAPMSALRRFPILKFLSGIFSADKLYKKEYSYGNF